MKLFQIEEPDGSPADPDAPGKAIGIDLTGVRAEVAVAVGGNAVMLLDREEFPLDLTIPPPTAPLADWQDLLEGARLRAERALAQPVTHAVVALATRPEAELGTLLLTAGEAAGIEVLQLVTRDQLGSEEAPALAAAILAEDLAPGAATA